MKIGFIGIGHMGRHIARNLAKGGHHLTVFDKRRRAAEELLSQGASWADSPCAVAEASQVVFTSLPSSQDVEEVASGKDGILSGAAPGSAFIDLSTISPDTIHRIATIGQAKGVDVLDAPVSGGTRGAEQATLCVMVGGTKSVYERYKPVLELIGNQVKHCGELGAGAVCKIVNNLINLGAYVLLSEGLTLGIKAGVKLGPLFDAISKSSGNTQSMQEFPESLFQGNFEPGFQLNLGAKDIGLATEMGRKLKVPMELANIIEQGYISAQNRGWGNLSSVTVVRLQEERANVKIRV